MEQHNANTHNNTNVYVSEDKENSKNGQTTEVGIKPTQSTEYKTQSSNKIHSICIPRVDAKISKGFIFNVFCRLRIGYIEQIIEMPIKDDPEYKRIFIKIRWNKSANANYIIRRLDENKNIKVVYSMPWYWICVSNTSMNIYSYNKY